MVDTSTVNAVYKPTYYWGWGPPRRGMIAPDVWWYPIIHIII